MTARQIKEITTSWYSTGIPKSKSLKYLVEGATDENVARSSVAAIAKSILPGNLKLSSFDLDDYKGGNVWIVSANYEPISSAELAEINNTTPEPQYSFDSSGGTATMTKAIGEIWKSEDAETMSCGMNWDGEQFNGVDVVSPNLVESHTISMKQSKFTSSYKRTLARLTGKVNSSKFKGWDAGEVLFLGAKATVNGDDSSDRVDVSFNFAISPNSNAGDINIGGIDLPKKEGWDYAWAIWEKTHNSPVIPKATAAYINRTYERADFGALGIGR